MTIELILFGLLLVWLVGFIATIRLDELHPTFVISDPLHVALWPWYYGLKPACKFTTSRLTGWVETVKTVINGPSKAMLANNRKTYMRTQVQIQTAAALVPFCKEKTAQARSGAGAARPSVASDGGRQNNMVKALERSSDSDTTLQGAKMALHALGYGPEHDYVKALDAAWDRYESGDDEESGSGSYPVGSVVVVTGGEAVSRAKRVLGKAYIVVGHDGDRPVPLGLRGQSEERRTPLNLSDIRPATDAELTAAVNSLNDAQTKMIVCELSEDEPWKSALETVIRNNGGYCRR